MLIDSRTLPADDVLDADVNVIGAGPAGITLAEELGAAGARVCLLESGTADGSSPQSLSGGESVGQRYYRLERTRYRAFGGASHLWRADHGGVRCRPLDALDLDARPEIGRRGWPFGRQVLERYYHRAQERSGLGPFHYEVGSWERPGAMRLPLPADDVLTTIFQFGPVHRWRERLRELERMPVIHLLTRATAVELEVDDADGRAVTAVRVATGDGRYVRVRARQVVLAAGGIENARLLLLSNRRQASGIGNAHDLVGRFFMEHPHVRTGIIRPEGPQLEPAVGLYQPHPVDGTMLMGMLAPSEQAVRREALLNSAWFVRPTTEALASDVGRALVDLRDTAIDRRLPLPPGTSTRVRTVVSSPGTAVRTMLRRRGRERSGQRTLLELTVMSEQSPNRESRVTLGDATDELGQRVARLDWRLTDLDRSSIRRTQKVFDGALRRAGIGRLESLFGEERPSATIGGGFHHMGTTRMDDDARQGVVDADGRVHGMTNLYVAGSSVFPTSGHANPTLTVVALAFRLADHLRGRLAAG